MGVVVLSEVKIESAVLKPRAPQTGKEALAVVETYSDLLHETGSRKKNLYGI